MPTHRTIMIKEDENEDELHLNMDLLQERREATAIREATYKTKMEQYYNQKANYVIREMHTGSCGMHIGARSMVAKAIRQGYYWPTIQRDARNVTQKSIDYFTKWIEAKPLARITEKDVKKFTWDNIVCQFGLPRIIVTDNKTQFVNDPFKGCLTYESEVVIPAEIGMPTHRTIMIREDENEDELHLNMDLLQERREAAAIREATYKTKMEQYYNQKVRPMSFKPDEYVFRRNEASRVEDQGKLGLKWERPYRVTETYQNGSYKLQTMEGKEVPRTWHTINLRK
nr:gypsy retrotransposon integrase-like protein 1 [Tanacetum cinerariifolium]